MRATLIKVCAATCLLFGGLQLLCNALDFLAGGGVVQLVLGFIWGVACVVCGLTTMAAPAAASKHDGEA